MTTGEPRTGGPGTGESVERAVRDLEAISSLNVLVRPPGPHAGDGSGPLGGLPMVVKDNIAVEGLPLTGGSAALEGYRPARSASAVRRMVRAGATVVGQANMHELARGTTSHNATYGPVRNPRDPSRMAGGSSGGTAAAVATAAVRAGLGSDTSGSGRIPAAMCGCVGFRPSGSRYPGDGVLHLSPTADTVTAMAPTVGELAGIDAVLSGDPRAAGREPDPVEATALRLGVPRDTCWNSLDSEVERVCDLTLEALAAEGVTLVEVGLGDLVDLATEVNLSMTAYEMREYWSRFAREHLDCDYATFVSRLASPDVAHGFGALVAGPPFDAERYAALRETKSLVARRYADTFAEYRLDALVFPPVPVTAPEVGADTVRVHGHTLDLLLATIANETAAPTADLPAVVVPAGTASDGLPVGIELDGPTGSDRRLLGIAHLVERCVGGPMPPAVTH